MALTGGLELCMSLPISCVLGPQTQSFEEVRMSDYLNAYRTTGRPPPPVPPLPTDPASRTAQGLPPLFVPAPFPGGPLTASSGVAPTATVFGVQPGTGLPSTSATNTDPAKLPIAQTFTPPVVQPQTVGGEREVYMVITVAPEYSHWSPEELRYYAYARGTRLPPPGTTMMPFAAPPPPAPGGLVPPTTDGEIFVSISARPEYADHSFEEHRVAFLRAGTELTSAQIATNFGLGNPQRTQSMDMNANANANTQNPLQAATPISPFAVPPASTSLFGQTPAPVVAAAPAAGGFAFGAPAPVAAAQPPAPVAAASGFSFGAAPAPAQPTGFSFGFNAGQAQQPAAPPPAAPAAAGFSFGQPLAQQQQQPQGAFSFSPARF
ncbi:hypothetical protein HMN09_00562300 [Mycena chlorophos]|uniref:Uncharacterized protein n=1 Tax=Mycena chlorophos TaxID=658473 RepID=A0A8H6TCF0_MYCCL|nr:hypothetical protein HMN09_00562300 [Mycena chlorophos]